MGLWSLLVASTLVLSPFSTPTAMRGAAEPQPDPSWDEPDAPTSGEPATTTTDPATPTDAGNPSDALAPAPAPAPAVPVPVPTPMVVTRPAPPSGLGLMIGAGVTGGLAWVTVLGRLGALNKCKSAVGSAVVGSGGGLSAATTCIRSTGSMLGLTLLGYTLNDVTYGLAPAAGVYRGKYDGVRAAWDGAPDRPTPVLVGVGAGLLAGGVVGRLATIVAFWRQLNPERLFTKYPLGAHFVLAQLSAASIQGGAGLLGYGLAYKKMRTNEEGRRKAAGLAELKLAPQLGWDYSGLSLVGRF